MDKIRDAAIILIGLGEKAASDILKNMNPKEVQAILEAINSIDGVTEEDVEKALTNFYKESSNDSGIDIVSKEQVKNSILMAVGPKGIDSIIQGIDPEKDKWLKLLRSQSMNTILSFVQDEHPQILTAVVIIIFNYIGREEATKLIKLLPKDLQNQIFKRMSSIGSISQFGIDALALHFENELKNPEKSSNMITLNGIEAVANIISYLDSETENEIISALSSENKEAAEQIQKKVFSFDRLAEMDRRSMQVLLKEVDADDLLLALKGSDEDIKRIFIQNMPGNSAFILKEKLESKGPAKLSEILDAQKRIISRARKLEQEERIVLTKSRHYDDVVV